MLASNGIGNIDKQIYDNSKDWQRLPGYVSTEIAIQNPFILFYVSENDWSSGHKYDYWNINFTSAASINNTAIEKTVYDPSVSGFCMPKTAAFTGFTTTGGYTSNSSQLNVSGSFNEGYNFFTGVSSGTIFIDGFGYRNTYNSTCGAINMLGGGGYYWLSGASSASHGRDLGFIGGIVNPQEPNPRSMGFSVRSVAEDNN